MNYGVAPEFQLDVVLPVGFGNAVQGRKAITLGNDQLALKCRFLHQRDMGVGVAFYPRLFRPARAKSARAFLNFHLIASAGPGIENADETDRYSWYGALLMTF